VVSRFFIFGVLVYEIPKKINIFIGERNLDNLLNFLLSQLSASILQPTVELPIQRPLLLEFCLRENDCISEEKRFFYI
jgi:hypothetical protein